MTTIHHSPPPGATPFAIYEDPEDHEPPSPSIAYEGDMSFDSELSLPGADDAIQSIELDPEESEDEPQPYRSSYTSRPSAISSSQLHRVSGVTTTSFISSIPSEISIASKPTLPANPAADSRYTPRKERPPFRNPSSVRAMQMSSPPPFASYESPRERLKGTYKLATPSRSGRSETPVSATGSRMSGRSRRDSQAQQSPRPTPTPQQHMPLVLLHVTILPMQFPYSHDLMTKAMPDWLVANYKLLEEKLQDIVMMRRGVLIPHPRDEYEMLEERILESLELKTPRLLKCGHFVAPEDSDEASSDEETDSITDDGTGRGSRMSGGTLTVDEDGELKPYASVDFDTTSVCCDCHQQLKKPGKGTGAGTRKWDIKIYAANGLMRSGAWSAAWNEMERCDVEISPWIPDAIRKDLDRRIAEEQEAKRRKVLYQAELQRQVAEEAARLKKAEQEAEEQRKAAELELQQKLEAEEAEENDRQEKLKKEIEDKMRLEFELNERIEEAKETIRLELEAQALAESGSVAERFRLLEERLKKEEEQNATQYAPTYNKSNYNNDYRRQSRGRYRSSSRRPQATEIPLGTLLRNYFLLSIRDQKNIAIVFLTLIIAFLAMHIDPSQIIAAANHPNVLPEDHFPNLAVPVSSVYVTTTATATATSISTTTVTHVQRYAESPSSSPETMMSALSSSSASVSAMHVAASESPVLLHSASPLLEPQKSRSDTTSISPESISPSQSQNPVDASESAPNSPVSSALAPAPAPAPSTDKQSLSSATSPHPFAPSSSQHDHVDKNTLTSWALSPLPLSSLVVDQICRA